MCWRTWNVWSEAILISTLWPLEPVINLKLGTNTYIYIIFITFCYFYCFLVFFCKLVLIFTSDFFLYVAFYYWLVLNRKCPNFSTNNLNQPNGYMFVYHHREWKSIYNPVSYPLRSLLSYFFSAKEIYIQVFDLGQENLSTSRRNYLTLNIQIHNYPPQD